MFSDLKYELTRGFAYRRIQHDHQAVYSTILPLIGGVLITLAYGVAPEKLSLLGKDGILASVLSVVSTLPGFYFAGLAAVATFGGAAMDTDMPDPPPTLKIRHKGVMIDGPLSRRKYMSYMFSYLVVMSFVLCVVILTLNAIQPTISSIQSSLDVWKWEWLLSGALELATVLGIALLSCSIAVTTLQGLFFLSERIHQP